MKKIYKFIIILFIFFGLDFSLSKSDLPVNSYSYILGFDAFRETAKETLGQNRIILLGGSSLGFGVSAEQLTERLEIPVLNSGIHAGVGYQHFIRNIQDVVDSENDLLVISPEYSLPSGDTKFGRSDEFCEIALYVRSAYPLECVGYSFTKLLKIYGTLDREDEEYRRDGFNRFGDYVYRIDGIDMVGKIENDDRCREISIDDLKNRYIPYIRKLEAEGFDVVYVPNFIPSSACSNPKLAQDFHNLLHQNFGVVLFESSQLLFDERYFYNTAYHLTNEGVLLKTHIFERQLKNHLYNQQ